MHASPVIQAPDSTKSTRDRNREFGDKKAFSAPSEPGAEKANRVMQAMMQMEKVDLATLEQAARA